MQQGGSRGNAEVYKRGRMERAGGCRGVAGRIAGAQQGHSGGHSPLCSPATESTALPPLSEPTLPPCSAGDVRSVEPSVAAVLPSSSDAGAKRIKRAVTSKNTAWEQLQTTLTLQGKGCRDWALGTVTNGKGAWG